MSRACFAQELNNGFFCYTEGHEYFAEVWCCYGVFGSVYLVSDWVCDLKQDLVADSVVYLIGYFPIVEVIDWIGGWISDFVADLVIYVHCGSQTWSWTLFLT